jgi:hypothetical protein
LGIFGFVADTKKKNEDKQMQISTVDIQVADGVMPTYVARSGHVHAVAEAVWETVLDLYRRTLH